MSKENKFDSFTDCLNKNVTITILGMQYNAQNDLENSPCVMSVSDYDFECYLQELQTHVEF